jgi:hypothetical protein
MASDVIGKQAVVIGAGIGGLAAAGALVDHFERVVVLERDALPPDAAHRAGTPQSTFMVCWRAASGRSTSSFPASNRISRRPGPSRFGSPSTSASRCRVMIPQRDLGFVGYSMSRPLIEFLVRRRVEGHANTTLRPRCRVRVAASATSCPRRIGLRSPRSVSRMPTGRARHCPPIWPSALCTLPGLAAHRSTSPNWLNTNSG